MGIFSVIYRDVLDCMLVIMVSRYTAFSFLLGTGEIWARANHLLVARNADIRMAWQRGSHWCCSDYLDRVNAKVHINKMARCYFSTKALSIT